MQRVSVKLPGEMVEELDDRADMQDVTRSDVIRDTLDDGLNTADDEEIQRLEERIQDREQRIEYLEAQVERLQRTNLKILEERDRVTDLEVYVDERRQLEKAGLWTRTKWWLLGKD